MASTFYTSVTSDVRTMKDMDNTGTSSTAADIIELRMGNGTYSPSREEVLLFLEKAERWVMQGGLKQAGANLPLPAQGTHG